LARSLAWLLVVGSTVGVERLVVASEPAGFRMLAIITVLLVAMKSVVGVEAASDGTRMSWWRWLGFCTLWFGMRPRIFAGERKPRDDAWLILRSALLLAVGGLALIVAAAGVWRVSGSPLLALPLLLPGISLCLHFGVLKSATAFWRLVGLDANLLFRAPIRSTSLTEFWGRRWNIAFSEMTAIAVYRPLQPVVGRRAATVLAFAFSGVLHEVAISVPVQTGYGLPMLYFVVHGGLILIERARQSAGRPIGGWPGWCWTVLWLALPLPILFHPAFVEQVLLPIIGGGG
ncbi:MAG: MBOAT family protein, partial [Planctomycetota bacterium]